MKKRVFREFREILIIAGVFGILYLTGLHTEVLGFAQRAVLATGIMNPSTGEFEDKEPAFYDFNLVDYEGETYDFSKNRGKVVFMNLWATWCPPCIAEMPGIQKLYNEFENDPNVSFVMVSLDDDFEKAKKFVDRKGFTFPVFAPDRQKGFPSLYRSGTIPTTFVLSKDGKIVEKKVGMAKYNSRSFIRYMERLTSGE